MKIRQRLLRKTKKLKVWLVDGLAVRNTLNVDFTMGGHGLVYPYIPKNEIWIEESVHPKERKAVMLHELYERNKMNEGYKYDEAHNLANWIEQAVRKRPSTVNREIAAQLKKVG